MSASTQRHMFYRTYKFRESEKDPVIDMFRTAMADAGYTPQQVHEESGVALSTFHNWFDGPTRMPKHATIAAALGAIGKRFAIVDSKERANGKALDARAPQFIKKFRSSHNSARV